MYVVKCSRSQVWITRSALLILGLSVKGRWVNCWHALPCSSFPKTESCLDHHCLGTKQTFGQCIPTAIPGFLESTPKEVGSVTRTLAPLDNTTAYFSAPFLYPWLFLIYVVKASHIIRNNCRKMPGQIFNWYSRKARLAKRRSVSRQDMTFAGIILVPRV
jgi:hypothetical protein